VERVAGHPGAGSVIGSGKGGSGKVYAFSKCMEHMTFDFLLGFLLALVLMAVLWVPLFFFDYRAEKKRGRLPAGSGENAPSPPLDKFHLN
jgi:hypothetical protein